ncbi:MAG: hypothetical protein JWR18_3258 [Segetibacter sp.]|jgi:hypothetical protein|nr:hypothetical protein [Segetibacter sp.]
MKIEFIKNIQFTKLVKADGQLREFNFRKISGSKEGLFSVDVSDDRGNRKMFKMAKSDNTWKIVGEDPLPDWIIKNESIFNELIEEELKING